jgi:hypothetical protein
MGSMRSATKSLEVSQLSTSLEVLRYKMLSGSLREPDSELHTFFFFASALSFDLCATSFNQS